MNVSFIISTNVSTNAKNFVKIGAQYLLRFSVE